jgi:hypothetical protein
MSELSDVRFGASESTAPHFSSLLGTEDEIEMPARVRVQVSKMEDRRQGHIRTQGPDTLDWRPDVEHGREYAKKAYVLE